MLHYWIYSWQAATFVLTGLHKNQMDCLEFHTTDGWKDFHRLPPGCAHFNPYFSSIILISSIGNCRVCLYNMTSDNEPWQGGWVHTAEGAWILRSLQILLVWLNWDITVHKWWWAMQFVSIKSKWNTFPTKTFFF